MAGESQENDKIEAVAKLDAQTSSSLRKGQIITKVSDVVRELVDNSVDAKAQSVYILLEKNGLDKIEVRDTGVGIAAMEFRNAVAGGYTSKLKTPEHLSCSKFYGFRGEALSSICSVANVCITTKTVNDQKATKYVLDKNGQVVSESQVAYGNGTIVVVEKMFANYPVRRQWIQDDSRCATELKEIGTYLKDIAIANPQLHISFYKDSSLEWSKASVSSIDQALYAVLGHGISKNLAKCGPFTIDVTEDEKRKRTLEAFFLKKPIDMRTMSYTANKFTMIFINRKRVYIREFEKLIQQYTAAVVEKPAPADKKRFPVSILNINVPANEIDFNLEMDKSKVHLVHKDEIYTKLEDSLANFYGVNLKELNIKSTSEKLDECENIEKGPNDKVNLENIVLSEAQSQQHVNDPAITGQRNESILTFLGNLPTASVCNFSQSPIKKTSENCQSDSSKSVVIQMPKPSVTFDFQSSKNKGSDNVSLVNNMTHANIIIDVTDKEKLKSAPSVVKSNFNLNVDDIWDMDSQIEIEKPASEMQQGQVNLDNWVHGRITDGDGKIIQNVALVRPPLSNGTVSSNNCITSSEENLSNIKNAFVHIGSGFTRRTTSSVNDEPKPSKRPRLSEKWDLQVSKANTSQQDIFSSSPMSISLSSTPRQVTLDSYKDWQVPGRRLSSLARNSPAGIRLPLSKPLSISTKRSSDNPIGIFPKSVRSTWENSVRTTSSLGLKKIVNLGNNLLKTLTMNSTQYDSSSKLIGEIKGSTLYMALVNSHLGAFSPMDMLHCYPSLKYDLQIDFEKTTSTSSEIASKYKVTKESAQKLFEEFLSTVDQVQSSDVFRKIFHILQDDVNHIQGGFTGTMAV